MNIKVPIIALCISFVFTLYGCGDNKKQTKDELLLFLNDCYDDEFTYVSVDEPDDKDRKDKKVRTVYTVESSDGITFCVEEVFQPMYWGGYYYYQDDYLVQWVLSQPDIYQELSESEYDCIEPDDFGNGDFILQPDKFKDIRSAAELALKIIQDNPLPSPKEDKSVNKKIESEHIIPAVKIGQYEMQFAISDDDKDIDFEQFVENIENSYVNKVRSGEINEALPYEVFEKYPPSEYRTVICNGEEFDIYFHHLYGDEPSVYKATDSNNSDFKWLIQLANSAGFRGSLTTSLSKESTVVSFDFYGDDSSSEGCIYKNSEKVDIQGRISYENDMHGKRYENVVLSIDDICNLFDLKAEFDMENAIIIFSSNDRVPDESDTDSITED